MEGQGLELVEAMYVYKASESIMVAPWSMFAHVVLFKRWTATP